MNYFDHHIGDYAEATGHLSILEDGAYSRLIRKYYATERALPVEIDRVQRLVGARTDEERAAVEAVLNEFFDLRDDGWHQDRCDEAIAAYQAGAPEREVKKTNEVVRQQRHRAERATLFQALHDAGQFPAWNTPIAEVRALVEKLPSAPITALTAPVTACNAPVTTPVTEPATACNAPAMATQYPVPSTQYPFSNTQSTHSVPNGTGADGAGPRNEAAPVDPIQAAAMLRVAAGAPLTDAEEKLIWNAGLSVLLGSYDTKLSGKVKEGRARTFIGGLGKRLKDGGLDNHRLQLFEVIQETCVERPVHPESWMSAAVAQRLGKRNGSTNKQTALEDSNLAAAAQFAQGS